MFPAYRDETWRSDVSASGPSYDSFSMDSGRKPMSRNEELKQGKKSQHDELESERAKERKRHQKEEKRRREMSVHSIKMVSIRSDDDSDSESDVSLETVEVHPRKERGKKKKHNERRRSSRRGRERKRRKRRRSSSSSESTSSTSSYSSSESECFNRPSIRDLLNTKEKWSFMKKIDIKVPSTFFVIDTKGDRSNGFYESVYKGELAKFHPCIRQVIGGDEVVTRMLFPEKEKPEKVLRYFDEKVRKTWSDQPERFWRRLETNPNVNVIPISMEPLLESDLPDEDVRSQLSRCDTSVMEVDLWQRSQMINRKLGADRLNVELWLQFLALQDELYLEQDEAKGQRRMKSERLTDGLLLERKMAIINKALEANVNSVKLKIERLKIGCYIWEKEKLHREIADLEFYHINDPEMWSGMLDVMKNESHWRLSDQLSKMSTCLDKISRVMNDQLRTHRALPGTEEFVATVIRRRIRLLMQSGYVEKAIASAQAICEYNLCLPEAVKKCSTADRRIYFKAFWESGIARIGDIGAKGWAKSIAALKAKEFVTDKEEYEKHQREYENAEKKVVTDGAIQNLGPNRVWLELEKLRARWLWRPLRDLETNPVDLERFVAYEDIQGALFDLTENVAVELVLNILEDFGAVIFGRDPTSPENIMQQFAILFPDVSPHFHEFDQFIGRFFLQLVPYLPEHRTVLLCSHITSAFAFIQRSKDGGNQRVTFKRFRDMAKEFFTYIGDAEEPLCVATFAEKFLELGDKKKAIALTGLLHKKDNIWNLENSSHQMGYLRLALVYVRTLESAAEKCDALSSIVMRGLLPDMKNPQKYEGREVQRQLNVLLSKVFASGVVSRSEGSMMDLCATLTLLTVYYNGDDANSYRFLCSTYESLTNKLEPNQLPLLTKTFLGLLSSYLMENPNKSPKLLLNKLQDAASRYPTSIAILERFISQCPFGLNIIPLRRFLSEDVKEVNALRCRCYGAVYLELLRHVRQLALNERHAPEIRTLMNVLRSAAERMQYEDDCFPRIALLIAKDRGDKELVEEVFYTARLNFPWSWALLIDFAESDPSQFVRLADTMIEKGIRLRTHSEELSILE